MSRKLLIKASIMLGPIWYPFFFDLSPIPICVLFLLLHSKFLQVATNEANRNSVDEVLTEILYIDIIDINTPNIKGKASTPVALKHITKSLLRHYKTVLITAAE